MKTKKCTQCKREFPMNSDYFFKKCDTKDGYTLKCKECNGKSFTNKLNELYILNKSLTKEEIDICNCLTGLKVEEYLFIHSALTDNMLFELIKGVRNRIKPIFILNDFSEKYNIDINIICDIVTRLNTQCYARVKYYCEYCKKENTMDVSTYLISSIHFCDKECQTKWFSEVYVKSDEFIERNRNIALNNLKNGVYSQTESQPQIIVDSLLSKMKLNFDKEQIIDYYAFDNYLIDYDLYIEVMGEYWHCDNRTYNKIEYNSQYKRVIKDKTKKNFLLFQHHKHILYLWEKDIIENIEMCKLLLLEYINKKGELQNYNSFNYSTINNSLELNSTIIKPFMDYDSEELNNHIEYRVKEDVNNYIDFNCINCNKEVHRLISKYNTNGFNCCSIKCRQEYHAKYNLENKNTKVKCSYCGKNIIRVNSRVNKNDNNYCDNNCKILHQRQMTYKNKVMVKCSHCNKSFEIYKSKYEKSKTKVFYCSVDCYDENKNNSRIECNCDYCNKKITKTKSNFNKNKHNFCNNECAIKYRNKK